MSDKISRKHDAVLNPEMETNSAPSDKACNIDAQRTVDAGANSGVGSWQGNGADVHFEKA